LDDAITSYRDALRLDPDLSQAHVNLGNALAELGRADDAVASYRAALAISPDIAEAHNNLGNALKGKGLLNDAVASYQEALRIAPDFPQAHINLGNALMKLGWCDAAAAGYREALRIDPASAPAHNNLGNALTAQGQPEKAMASYREAIRIDPEYAAAHSNLGTALEGQGRLNEAEASYREALRIDPGFTDAHHYLGQTLLKLSRFDEAIPYFEAAGTGVAKANVLECLYAAGRTGSYAEYLSELCRSDPINIRAAAVSAFVAHQWGTDNPYPFCRNPLDFIYTTNLESALAPFDGFVAKILEEIEDAPALWDPEGNAVRGGFHTIGDLFQMETPAISVLRDALWERIDDYRSRYAGRDDGLIRQWPQRSKLTCWHVRLLESGHMVPHIHTSGWLSGVIYLKIPDDLEGDQGTITFSLHGYDYPIRNDDIPTVRHMPKEGDLILFPSSLFHFTAPFQSTAERQCISFDIYPQDSSR
jgi:tetratricopeptide (TPR) repeat protein